MPWQVVNSIQLLAGNTIINLNGLFLYDGTPASGNLFIAAAPAAGTDQFTNVFAQGIAVGRASDTAQVQLVPASPGAASVRFPLAGGGLTLNNVPNVAGGVIAATYGELLMSGPALSAVGQRDWVQMIMFSNDTAGAQARLELRYINDAQSPSVMMAMNGNTGVTFHSSVSIDAGNGPFVTGETFHTITGAAGLTGTLRIKKVPWNMVYLDVLVSWTATAATTFTCGSLPDATYYPTVNDPGNNTLLDLASNAAWNTDTQARVFIPTSGAIQVIVGASAAGGNGCFRGFYATN